MYCEGGPGRLISEGGGGREYNPGGGENGGLSAQDGGRGCRNWPGGGGGGGRLLAPPRTLSN